MGREVTLDAEQDKIAMLVLAIDPLALLAIPLLPTRMLAHHCVCRYGCGRYVAQYLGLQLEKARRRSERGKAGSEPLTF